MVSCTIWNVRPLRRTGPATRMLSVVSARYARALVDVVTAPGSKADPAQVLSQLRAVQELVHGSTVLQNALNSPAVAPSRKRAVMRRLLEPMGVLTNVRNFVYVVIDHRRAHDFASIVDGFETLAGRTSGICRGGSSQRDAAHGCAARHIGNSGIAPGGQEGKTQIFERSHADRRRGRACRLHRLRRQCAGAIGKVTNKAGSRVSSLKFFT